MAEQVGRDDSSLGGELTDQVGPAQVRAQQAVDEDDGGAVTRVDVVEVAAMQCCGRAGERFRHEPYLLKLLVSSLR
jgi:hypothetical protein